ncbi:MAG: hypothetical protein S4CHLAM7_14730 [Chlamydiae bacterium]|nr:hypothetical protein [Chlamydiota bacterium]
MIEVKKNEEYTKFMSTYIFESNKIESILDFIDLETFFITDIDDTLIKAAQIIGSSHWEKHLIRRLIDQGVELDQARSRACGLWKQIQKLTNVITLEEGVFKLIQFLKKHSIPTLGLTSRDCDLIDLTFEQLKKVDLHDAFTLKHAPQTLEATYLCHFARGALFCGNNAKDKALKVFFEQNNLNPKKIIFIDDQKDHLYELEEMAFHAGIDYVGMQYTASSPENFSVEIAEIQEKHLPNIISDEDAQKLIQN